MKLLFLCFLFALVGIAAAELACDAGASRTGCGFIGIDQTTCLSDGCCWDTTSAPYCFNKTEVAPVSTPVSGDNSYTYTFAFTGGVSFCSQCGANGQYACSDKSNWNGDNLSFTDSTPAGDVPTSIMVTLLGSYGCNSNGNNQIQVFVNDMLIDVDSVEPIYQCACATCDGKVSFLLTSPNGIPGIVVGGSNVLSIVSLYDTVCLNTATLTVGYSKDSFGFQSMAFQAGKSSGSLRSSSPVGVCGSKDYYHIEQGQNARFSFSNPLPANNMLVTATFILYGRYFMDDGFHNSSTISVSMGLAPAIQQTITYVEPSPPMSTNQNSVAGCDGSVIFTQTQYYQNGWPSYSTGTNYVYVNAIANVIDISSLWVELYYIPDPSAVKSLE